MFEDREDAALKLSEKLRKYMGRKDVIVVGLTRGGVITAKVISENLHLKLKALVVKKIGAPGNLELAIGALVSKNNVFWNSELVKRLGVSREQKDKLIEEKEKEVKRLSKKLKVKNKKEDFKRKVVIVADDGVATGASVITASLYLKKLGAKQVILATPVVSFDALRYINKYFDNVVLILRARDFYSVSQFYTNFLQISDEETAKILNE